jgi:hypothetical protein
MIFCTDARAIFQKNCGRPVTACRKFPFEFHNSMCIEKKSH